MRRVAHSFIKDAHKATFSNTSLPQMLFEMFVMLFICELVNLVQISLNLFGENRFPEPMPIKSGRLIMLKYKLANTVERLLVSLTDTLIIFEGFIRVVHTR